VGSAKEALPVDTMIALWPVEVMLLREHLAPTNPQARNAQIGRVNNQEKELMTHSCHWMRMDIVFIILMCSWPKHVGRVAGMFF
jgi:hypothetical protein